MNRPIQVSLLRFSMLLIAGAVAFVAVYDRKQCEPTQQVLPSPYYIGENIQYFAPPGFKLQREAAAMRAYKEQLDAQHASNEAF